MAKAVQDPATALQGVNLGLESERAQQVAESAGGNSDSALLALLDQLKQATDPIEIQRLSEQVEKVVFHKQHEAI